MYRDDKQILDRTDKTYMLENMKNIYIKAKKDKDFRNIMHNKMFIIPGVVFGGRFSKLVGIRRKGVMPQWRLRSVVKPR